MLNGTFALLGRSLRLDARSMAPNLARLGLMSGIYTALCMMLFQGLLFGAPGLHFFTLIVSIDTVFMTLLGVSFFSTAITEEKEEDTLGLMLMAGISPVGILAGKSGGRLWQAILLVTVQYPFTLLAITMGGVTSTQIWAATVALLAYMIFLAGLGLFCSTVAPRSGRSAAYMIVGIAAYYGLPTFTRGVAWLNKTGQVSWTQELGLDAYWWNLMDRFGDVCLLFRLQHILQSGFDESAFGLQVVSNVGAGLFCALLSWLLFGIAARSPTTESSTRGLVSTRRAFFRFSAGRSWGNPLLWKDFYFASGGIWMLMIRTAFYVALALGIWTWQQLLFLNRDIWIEVYLTWVMCLLPVDLALLVARSMHDEVRGQTLAALMMLPRSSPSVVYSKLAGALLGWLPGPMIGLTVVLTSDFGQRGIRYVCTHNELWLVPLMFLFFSLVPHYAALLALYVRWGAVPLAIGATIGTYIGIVSVASIVGLLFGRGIRGPGSPEFHLIMGAITLTLLVLNAGVSSGSVIARSSAEFEVRTGASITVGNW